jgi:hypothetical protein
MRAVPGWQQASLEGSLAVLVQARSRRSNQPCPGESTSELGGIIYKAVRVEASTFETNRAHLRGNRSSELGGNIMAVLLLEESRVSARPGWVGENECAHLD